MANKQTKQHYHYNNRGPWLKIFLWYGVWSPRTASTAPHLRGIDAMRWSMSSWVIRGHSFIRAISSCGTARQKVGESRLYTLQRSKYHLGWCRSPYVHQYWLLPTPSTQHRHMGIFFFTKAGLLRVPCSLKMSTRRLSDSTLNRDSSEKRTDLHSACLHPRCSSAQFLRSLWCCGVNLEHIMSLLA